MENLPRVLQFGMNDYKCNFCAAYIGWRHSHEDWLSHYVVLYTRGLNWEVVTLTPPSPVRHDHQNEGRLAVPGLACGDGTPMYLQGEIPTFEDDFILGTRPANFPEDVVFGFTFHHACWQLFDDACGHTVDNVVLMRLLRSLRPYHTVVDWGNDWGGLVWKNPDRYNMQQYSTKMFAVSGANPYSMNKLTALVESCIRPRHERDIRRNEAQRYLPSPSPSEGYEQAQDHCLDQDPFLALGNDIRELILHQLSSVDVCNVRIVSRSFASTQLSQAFWRSRFCKSREYGHIIETRSMAMLWTFGKAYLDWYELYDGLRTTQSAQMQDEAMLNRRRIWYNIILPASQILASLVGVPLHGEPLQSPMEMELPISRTLYNLAKRAATAREFEKECRSESSILYVREIQLRPEPPKAILASFLKLIDGEYLTGLRFVYDNETQSIGWILDDSCLRPLAMPQVGSRRQPQRKTQQGSGPVSKAGKLAGFKTWSRPYLGGIRGIAPIHVIGRRLLPVNKWEGQIEKAEEGLSVVPGAKIIDFVQASFDGIRMLTLGVA